MKVEQRQTERLELRIPIRVVGFSEATGEFSEDTHTVVVNRAGARIFLNKNVMAGDEIRIINLENYSEADFRVVGPTHPPSGEGTEWGVECTEADRNIWGIGFPAPVDSGTAAALLECRACQMQVLWPLSLMQVEVLDTTAEVTGVCDHCKRTTYWVYAEASRRPREFSPSEPVAPVREVKTRDKVEKRTDKRLAMKLPILVRNNKGFEEITKTENISKRGLAVNLSMELIVSERVEILCPYNPGGEKIWQKGEVRRRGEFTSAGKRPYGMRYVR